MKTRLLFMMVVTLYACNIAVAQNTFPSSGSVGIGTITPGASAILEIKSTNKGMLIPRMSKMQRNAIASPATGLLIYQTDNTPGFYYYNGTIWTTVGGASVSLSNLSNTAINTNLSPDTNSIHNIGVATRNWKNIYYNGSMYQGTKRLLYADSTGNYFAGLNAGVAAPQAVWNTVVGNNAFFSNTSGEANSVLGYAALQTNTTGSQNTAIGFGAMEFNTYGYNNTAVGAYTLYSNVSGIENIAIGSNALANNINGSDNVAIGESALHNLSYSVFSNFNTAIGKAALDSLIDGSDNVAVGDFAGRVLKHGAHNTFIGSDASTMFDVDNTIVIGFQNPYPNYADNTGVFGNTSTKYLVAEVPWYQFSDGRVKDNIQTNVPGLEFINKLRAVTYNLNVHHENALLNKNNMPEKNWTGKYDNEKRKMTGFIAQEVEKAANDIGYDFSGIMKPQTSGGLYGLSYSEFVVPLVKAVQELSKMNDEKDSLINNLEARMEKLEAMMNVQKGSAVNSTTGNELKIIPNPFTSATNIQYRLSQKFTTAKIIIADNAGVVQKQINIANNYGVVNLNTTNLAAGVYNCVLYINGNVAVSRQIIKTSY